MPTSIFQKSTSWLLKPLVLLACSTVLISSVSGLAVSSSSTESNDTTSVEPTRTSGGGVPTITVANLPDHTITIDIFGINPPPACAFSCKSFNRDVFTDNIVPCESVTNDEERIKCLCTDRPYLKHIFSCIFKSCGPAMNGAIDFGYNMCQHYNISLPKPTDIIKVLELEHPPAIRLNDKIENVTFSDSIPPNEKGARGDLGGYYVEQPFPTPTPDAAPGSVELSYRMGFVVLVGVIGGFLV
ncbi:hypothetical protein BJ508DRAFT_310370 [Ascobolus immersus RN42]|uniref:Extracellular membrane protein CFEM domain-containing protein n=1 Tax=Ascobolus immersus RN42 TaxID=1160509 RepID=A0A3N4HTL6_ASCIM|nr:hypothetical protein BJ508DRAFT_310370 [Ascobolus immersus RN42]